MLKNKFGFVLEQKSRQTGALLQNWEVYQFLKNKRLPIAPIIPKTQYFIDNVKIIGTIFNYFTVYPERKKFEYCIANSVAGAPFLENDTKLISIFHAFDSGNVRRVLEILDSETQTDKRNREKWMKKITKTSRQNSIELMTRARTREVIEEACLQKAEAAICVSPMLAKDIQKRFKCLPRKGLSIILNGIPDYFFSKRKLNQIITKPNVNIVFSSRLSALEYTIYEKGIDRMLGIFSKKFNHANKLVIGHLQPGEIKTQKKWRNELKTINTQFINNLNRNEIPHYQKKGDIFIFTSRTESFGLALAEAMASGLIPVSYPVGIAPLVIKNGKTGYLVNSITEAQDKIDYLIRHTDERLKMSNQCIAIAKKKFGYQRMLDEYYDFFKQF